MDVIEEKGEYKIESASKKGTFYTIDPKKPWCDCADFKFREMKRKGVCKHIKAVREYIEKNKQQTITSITEESNNIIEHIEKQGGEADTVELIDRFGEEKIDSLIKSGELIEHKGKITILK